MATGLLFLVLLSGFLAQVLDQLSKYARGETATVRTLKDGEGGRRLPTVSVCPYSGFKTGRMSRQLGLAPEHWSMVNLDDEGDGGWSRQVDRETYRDLWESSTYSLAEILASVTYADFNDARAISSIHLDGGSQEASHSSGGGWEVARHVRLEERSSFAFGKCAVIRVLDTLLSSMYLLVNVRYCVTVVCHST